MAPSNPAPGPPPGDVEPREPDGRLVHLRLEARVVAAAPWVRLVGEGLGVEITAEGATTVHVHNEPVDLALHAVAGWPAAQAERLLRRWQALDQRIGVELLTVRSGHRLRCAGRRVEITDRDGAVLRWHEAGAPEAPPPSRQETRD